MFITRTVPAGRGSRDLELLLSETPAAHGAGGRGRRGQAARNFIR
jgi:hypothetical protein